MLKEFDSNQIAQEDNLLGDLIRLPTIIIIVFQVSLVTFIQQLKMENRNTFLFVENCALVFSDYNSRKLSELCFFFGFKSSKPAENRLRTWKKYLLIPLVFPGICQYSEFFHLLHQEVLKRSVMPSFLYCFIFLIEADYIYQVFYKKN
jgi:hypothetical protein